VEQNRLNFFLFWRIQFYFPIGQKLNTLFIHFENYFTCDLKKRNKNRKYEIVKKKGRKRKAG